MADDAVDARTVSMPPAADAEEVRRMAQSLTAPEVSETGDTLPRGTTLGRYVIIDVIGHGGMGVVYSAYDAQLGRKLAIKFVRGDKAESSPRSTSRLLREAQAMARLSHRNVIGIYDVGTYKSRVFLVMEFVLGQTLHDWIASNPPWRSRLERLISAGEGLAAAHAAGVIHRDFKPDNVLIGDDGRVVVMDFGLAREAPDSEFGGSDGSATAGQHSAPPAPRLSPSAPPPAAAGASAPPIDESSVGDAATGSHSGAAFSTPLTQAGHVVGTLGYMAPEQAYGQATTTATDQFSYCVTAYATLYGHPPFSTESVKAYIQSIFRGPPPPPVGARVPLRVRKILLRGMSRKPEDRYPSMGALLSALRHDPRVAWRRWAAAGFAAFSVLSLAIYVARVTAERRRICAPDPGEWTALWDEPARVEMRRAFRAAEPVNGARAAERSIAPLDSYVAKWDEMRTEACTASRIEKRQSEEVLQLRADCLERRKVQFASVARLLRNADRDVVQNAVSMVYGLEPLSWCADAEGLRQAVGLPDDAGKRARVVEVRAKLADVRALSKAGKHQQSSDVARAAVPLARLSGHGPTIAEALAELGSTLSRLEANPDAVAALRESLENAVVWGADRIAATAAVDLAFVTGPRLQKPDDCRMWLGLARSFIARIGGDERLSLEALNVEAALLEDVELRPEAALPLHEKQAEEDRRLYGSHPDTETAIFNIGVAHSYLGDYARAQRAFEEARAMAEALGGPLSEDVGIDEYMLGQALLFTGDLHGADQHLNRAVDILEPAGAHYWLTFAFQVHSSLELIRGDPRAALAYADRAFAHFEAAHRANDLAPYAMVPRALALLQTGHPAEALSLCEAARESQESATAISAEKVYVWDALRCRAEALLALGRSAEAIVAIERSLTLRRRMFPADYGRAEFAAARTLTALRLDPARAYELARAARTEFAKFPFLGLEEREIAAWLQEHEGK